MGILELADKLWRGEVTVKDHHPFSFGNEIAEVAPRTGFVQSFANVAAFATDDGLVLVDTGSMFLAPRVHETLRTWNGSFLNTAVFTHGHVDHVFGVPIYEEESATNGWRAPVVVAHEDLPKRFDRYVLTAGHNGAVNSRQFQAPGLRWPTDYRYPDTVYAGSTVLDVGGESFELYHGRGETDDATWVYAPARKVLACGDFFIWASPNAGNPQKVRRFAKDWGDALRAMAATDAEVLLPGHGVPIIGRDRVVTALTDAATLLEYLHDETLRLMNEGAALADIVDAVRAPQELLDKPYLRPVYDEPEFVVRNVWRLYGGWWDGDPSHLKPATPSAFAREMASLAGGVDALAARAMALAASGDDASLRLAAQLAHIAVQAEPLSTVAHEARAAVFETRVEAEASTMSKGVFSYAAAESRRALEPS